jgi:hypothetical protein
MTFLFRITVFFILIFGTGSLVKAEASLGTEKCFKSGSLACIGHPSASDIRFTVDIAKKVIRAKARIYFRTIPQAAKAFFLFDPVVREASLNNRKINVERLKAPGNEDNIIVVPLKPGKTDNILELEYEVKGLTRWGLNWQPFHWLTDFSDSSDARFINAFAPASFEGDRYPMTYTFEFKGLKVPINLYTSASLMQQPQKNIYKLGFAKWNNLAGPYFEFTTLKFTVEKFTYRGKYKPVPVLLYFPSNLAEASNLTGQTENLVRMALDKFETTMGEYPFDKLLVKLYSLQKGDLPLIQEYSMEYDGAVISRQELIPHEICHQWFGRGASPADGEAGFADELICDWYDYNNPVKAPLKLRQPTRLISGNPFTLRTPEESYQYGLFLGETAYLFKQKNLNIYNFLKNFYRKYRLSSYSKEDFMKMLEQEYHGDLGPYFRRYVYGEKIN